MKLSDAGLDLIKSFESCRLFAYQDSGGKWTIGWGHTGPDVYSGLIWTQPFADSMLEWDTQDAQDAVNRLVTVTLTQGEFDALVSFEYNTGALGPTKDNPSGSTMLRLLNAGDIGGAAGEFEKWDHVHGVVVAGLLRRRIAEKGEFDGDDLA